MKKDFDAALKAGSKHRKLLLSWIELARKHKKANQQFWTIQKDN